jgi:glycosyltransferase involved in cell wall biosynthesis
MGASVIKVLLVIPTLDRSGAEKQFSLLATGLPQRGFDVRTVALTRGGPYEQPIREAGIPLDILHKRWKLDPATLWKLRRIVRSWKPDILHSWLFAANASVRLVAGRKNLPKVIVSERCVDTWKSGWQLALDRRQIRRTTRMIANSNSVAEFYVEHGFPPEGIVVIPNGVEAAGPNACEREKILAELDIPAGSRIVGSVGRLARQKRVCDLVWAMQLLRQLTDRVYFVVVGDGPERYRAERLARHMGCDHLMRFVGHRSDASRFFASMDVFWLGSDFEGMSNSVMEAMAAGVPVVATNIPPNRELVTPGETGFLVDVGDCVGIAQFTDRLLADREKSQAFGNAGRDRMQREFSVEQMIDRHAALYRDVAAN